MVVATTSNSWTGTPGVGVSMVVIRSPDVDMEVRAAKAAVEFVIREFGHEEALSLTLKEMFELFLDLDS